MFTYFFQHLSFLILHSLIKPSFFCQNHSFFGFSLPIHTHQFMHKRCIISRITEYQNRGSICSLGTGEIFKSGNNHSMMTLHIRRLRAGKGFTFRGWDKVSSTFVGDGKPTCPEVPGVNRCSRLGCPLENNHGIDHTLMRPAFQGIDLPGEVPKKLLRVLLPKFKSTFWHAYK